MDPAKVTFVLGLAAAIFWLASAAASVWALFVKLDLGNPSKVDSGSLEIYSSSGGDGPAESRIVFDGMEIPSFEKVDRYRRDVTLRNGLTAVFNALGAICATGAALMAFV